MHAGTHVEQAAGTLSDVVAGLGAQFSTVAVRALLDTDCEKCFTILFFRRQDQGHTDWRTESRLVVQRCIHQEQFRDSFYRCYGFQEACGYRFSPYFCTV